MNIDYLLYCLVCNVILLLTIDYLAVALKHRINFKKDLKLEDYDFVKSNKVWILYSRISDEYISKFRGSFLFKYVSKDNGVIPRFSKLSRKIDKYKKDSENLPVIPVDFYEDEPEEQL